MKRDVGKTCPVILCPNNYDNGKCKYYLCRHGIFDIEGNEIKINGDVK